MLNIFALPKEIGLFQANKLLLKNAGVVELVDTMDSKSIGGNPVTVQPRPSVLFILFFLFQTTFAQLNQEESWQGFKPDDFGISTREFTKIKQAGISPSEFRDLLSRGIQPAIFIKAPWVNMGITREEWLEARSQGFEDLEIAQNRGQAKTNAARLSLLLPGYAQWKTHEPAKALAIHLFQGSFLGLAYWLHNQDRANAFPIFLFSFSAPIYSWWDGTREKQQLEIRPLQRGDQDYLNP